MHITHFNGICVFYRNQLAAEAYRSKLDLKEAELKEYKTIIESLEQRYMINHYMYTMQ